MTSQCPIDNQTDSMASFTAYSETFVAYSFGTLGSYSSGLAQNESLKNWLANMISLSFWAKSQPTMVGS
jgi:hypothetical protein